MIKGSKHTQSTKDLMSKNYNHKNTCQCSFCKVKRGETAMHKKKHKQSSKDKMSNSAMGKHVGKKSGSWIDGRAWKTSLHCWVVQQLGKASKYKCVDCANQAYDWCNVDHSYQRELDDYAPRCRSCHALYDKQFNKTKRGRPLQVRKLLV